MSLNPLENLKNAAQSFNPISRAGDISNKNWIGAPKVSINSPYSVVALAGIVTVAGIIILKLVKKL